jgi:hypothetical protein
LEFANLKHLLNKLNHVRNLRLRLESELSCTDNTSVWNSVIDATFIRQYCMADVVENLMHFNFHIVSGCKLPSNNVQKIISSFKNHPFFAERQWTNVKCLFNSTVTYQHLFTSARDIPQLVVDFV